MLNKDDMKTATVEDFHKYLESLNLFRWSIKETPSAFEAILSQDSKPILKNFTQVMLQEDKTIWVRLSKEDFQNDKITKGFF